MHHFWPWCNYAMHSQTLDHLADACPLRPPPAKHPKAPRSQSYDSEVCRRFNTSNEGCPIGASVVMLTDVQCGSDHPSKLCSAKTTATSSSKSLEWQLTQTLLHVHELLTYKCLSLSTVALLIVCKYIYCLKVPYPYTTQLTAKRAQIPAITPHLPADLLTIYTPLVLSCLGELLQHHPDTAFTPSSLRV